MSDLDQLLHELLTPLSTLLLWEEILRTTDEPVRQAEAIAAIRASAQLQARLIGDMRELDRARRGALELAPTRVAADELVRAAIARRSEPVRATLARDAWLHADAPRLGRALDRLLEPPGELALELAVDGEHVVVALRGAPFAPAIGHAFARAIVELHGGTLSGTGTSAVEIRLPRST